MLQPNWQPPRLQSLQSAPGSSTSQHWTRLPESSRKRPAVLFVCTANRIRSPLAEHLLVHMLRLQAKGDAALAWTVESAGIWAEEGLAPMEAAIQAGRELGIDLSNHRSRSIGAFPVEQFDLILGMERKHCAILQKELPAVAHRVMTLGEGLSGYAFDVLDPPKHAPRAIRATAKELAQILRWGFDSLQAQVERAATEREPWPAAYPAAD